MTLPNPGPIVVFGGGIIITLFLCLIFGALSQFIPKSKQKPKICYRCKREYYGNNMSIYACKSCDSLEEAGL